jgi:hypothetical protein
MPQEEEGRRGKKREVGSSSESSRGGRKRLELKDTGV